MRLISLVPSWTETLIECEAEVVGRTRFCIHPHEKIKNIRALGGTKQIDLEKLSELNADLCVLDREENPKELAESLPIAYFASNIQSVEDMPGELEKLAQRLESDLTVAKNLRALKNRWQVVLDFAAAKNKSAQTKDWRQFPGVIEWIHAPTHEKKVSQFLYIIWKNPYMAVGPQTFIASVLRLLGWSQQEIHFSEKYPVVDLSHFEKDKTVLLFSSEPYPFFKERQWLKSDCKFTSAIVDGEAFSWFGLRTLRFIEANFGIVNKS